MQADTIRAPARAQDLTLRHRVNGYRAGDLERPYARLPTEEDVLVNYDRLAPGARIDAALRWPASRTRGERGVRRYVFRESTAPGDRLPA